MSVARLISLAKNWPRRIRKPDEFSERTACESFEEKRYNVKMLHRFSLSPNREATAASKEALCLLDIIEAQTGKRRPLSGFLEPSDPEMLRPVAAASIASDAAHPQTRSGNLLLVKRARLRNDFRSVLWRRGRCGLVG